MGHLPDESADLHLCDGEQFSSARFQAMRLGEPDANGQRTVVATTRNMNAASEFKRVKFGPCIPSGTIRIVDLRDGEKVLPLSDVTNIIAPW